MGNQLEPFSRASAWSEGQGQGQCTVGGSGRHHGGFSSWYEQGITKCILFMKNNKYHTLAKQQFIFIPIGHRDYYCKDTLFLENLQNPWNKIWSFW